MMGLSGSRNSSDGRPASQIAQGWFNQGQQGLPEGQAAPIPVGSPLTPQQHSPLPLTAQPPQVQPGQYPHLQNFAHSQNPFVAILGRSLISGMENRRTQAGMTPEEWQAQIDQRRAAFRQRRGF
jgi:hypothetical protein